MDSIANIVERSIGRLASKQFVDNLLAMTYEEEARISVRGFHDRKDACPDAAENYTVMFVADYGRALNWKYTSAEVFLDAYTHRELAIINGADEQELDRLAYQLRQEWAERTRKGSGNGR